MDHISGSSYGFTRAEVEAARRAAKSRCCMAPIYRDPIDGGHYCSLCDSAVDAKTGKPNA